ncbi:hypothetical protein ACFWIA_15130 [Streptomyces sp. NPDC127068]|uniref:hypothetical protein n=1 Tax=Streptomyces sp. NPDC127068 TaxID=3347127 RepID=UPI00365978C0
MDDLRDPGDAGLRELLTEGVARKLNEYWAERGATVRARAERWDRSGFSGAVLVQIVVTHRDGRDERLVVKLLPSPRQATEAQRHDEARRSVPEEFAAAHLVPQPYPSLDVGDGNCLMFQGFPASTDEVVPLGEVDPAFLPDTCGELVRLLLGGWNPTPGSLRLRSTTVGAYLAEELAELLPLAVREHQWPDGVGTFAHTGPWVREHDGNTILPNPCRLIEQGSEPGARGLDFPAGRSHGDLHLGNALVAVRGGRPLAGQQWLIDLADYREEAPLGRDIAALVLSVALPRAARIDPTSGEADELIRLVVDPLGEPATSVGRGIDTTIRAITEECRTLLRGRVDLWTGSYLWSIVARALVHTSFTSLGPARWWFARLAAHAAGAALARHPEPSTPGDLVQEVTPSARATAPVRPRLLHRHAEVVAAVRGRMLLEDELPWLSTGKLPGPQDLVPPHTTTGLPTGVLLIGAGGTGKTRWCLEAAARAEDNGVPAFYLGGADGGIPAQAALSTGHLVDELTDRVTRACAATGASTALLVIDGIDRFPSLDLVGLRDLLNERAYGGLRVTLLAATRPGGIVYQANRRGIDVLFPRQHRMPSEPAFRSRLLRHVLNGAVDPTTRQRYGGTSALRARLHDSLGDPLPPAVPLVWAPLLTAARSADEVPDSLFDALGAHLSGRPGDPVASLAAVLPAGAALAAAPLARDRLTAVVATALTATARGLGTAAPTSASALVSALLDCGLLHQQNSAEGQEFLVTPHRTAADQLLTQMARTGPGGPGLGMALDAAAADPVAVAHTAWSISVSHATADETTRGHMVEQCTGWMDEHAAALGHLLAASTLAAAGALEVLLYVRPWHRITKVYWTQLAQPWFAREQSTPADPLLLARGLYQDRNELRETLVDTALGWLEQHAGEPAAEQVLRWLLRRHREMRGPLRDQGLRHADTFLAAHPDLRPNHVLAAALVQTSADPERTQPLADRALEETEAAPGAVSNAPVLAAVLSRRDIDERTFERAVELGADHLARHPLEPTSNEVLKWLLSRRDVPPDVHRQAAGTARRWLLANGDNPQASHVLSGVFLDRRGRTDDQVQAARLAVSWLEEHYARRSAIWVLTDLVAEAGELIPDDCGNRLAAAAQRWLRSWPDEAVTPATISRTLDLVRKRSRRPARVVWPGPNGEPPTAGERPASRERSPEAVGLASAMGTWLKDHGSTYPAFAVLGSLLALPDGAPRTSPSVVRRALDWLDLHRASPNATVVLQPLLSHADLRRDERSATCEYTLAWLDANATHPTGIHVTQRLLTTFKRLPPDGEQLRRGIGHALKQLEHLARTPKIPPASRNLHVRLLRACLTLELDAEQREELLAHGWSLYAHGDLDVSKPLMLQSFLSLRRSAAPDQRTAVEKSLEWLGAHGDAPSAVYVLKGWAARKDLVTTDDEHAGFAAAVRGWLGEHPSNQYTGGLVRLLLDRTDLDGDTLGAAVAAGAAWVRAEPPPPVEETAALLQELLPRLEGAEGHAAVVARAFTLLNGALPWQRETQVVEGLLRCPALDAARIPTVIDQALITVGDFAGEQTVGRLLQRLAERPDLTEQQVKVVMDHARTWWDRHHAVPSAPYLAQAMFARPEHLTGLLGHRTWQQRMTDDLVAWLALNEQRGSLPCAVRLLAGRPLSVWQVEETVRRGSAWLATHGAHRSAQDVTEVVDALGGRGEGTEPEGDSARPRP